MDVIHCTYLVRADVIRRLRYDDGSGRHEYVIFSDSARRNDVPQYLDTREVYGYLTLQDNHEPAVRQLGPTVGLRLLQQRRQENAWQMVFSCGLHSSGSTWMFNLVREIAIAAGLPFLSQFAGEEADFIPVLSHGARLIVKVCAPPPGMRTFIAASHEPVTLTVRDPRDAIVSLMNRFGDSFEDALDKVAGDAEHACWAGQDAAGSGVALRRRVYHRRRRRSTRSPSLLGATLSAAQRTSILHKLERDEVRKTIDELAGPNPPDAGLDLVTHWQVNHIGDGRVGKFADVLSPIQQAAVIARAREFCAHFGYDATQEAEEPREKTFNSCPVCGATETTKPRLADLEPHPYHRCRAVRPLLSALHADEGLRGVPRSPRRSRCRRPIGPPTSPGTARSITISWRRNSAASRCCTSISGPNTRFSAIACKRSPRTPGGPLLQPWH